MYNYLIEAYQYNNFISPLSKSVWCMVYFSRSIVLFLNRSFEQVNQFIRSVLLNYALILKNFYRTCFWRFWLNLKMKIPFSNQLIGASLSSKQHINFPLHITQIKTHYKLSYQVILMQKFISYTLQSINSHPLFIYNN